MVKSCDSALDLALAPRRGEPRRASYSLARAVARWINHGYEGARLEEW